LYTRRVFLSLHKELFDSIAPQNAENRTVAKSLPLFLKYSVKWLFFKWLYQTVENLKYVFRNERGRIEAYQSARNSGLVIYGSDPGDEYWEAKAVTVMITLKGFVKLEELSRKKRSVFEKYGRFTI
jgi:hypothetical protein